MRRLGRRRQGKRKQTPIFRKLFITFSCFALIPVVFIGVISLYVSNRIMYRNLQNNMADSVSQVSLMADGRLEEMKYISENFTFNSRMKSLLQLPLNDENVLLLNDELEKMNRVNSERGYFVTLCGANGQIYLNWESDGMIYRDSLIDRIKAKTWFSKLEESRSLPVWVPSDENIAGYEYQGKVVTLARNIMNDTLEGPDILGFVVVSIPAPRISKLLSGESERMLIVDESRVIVMSRDTKEIGTVLEGISLEGKKFQNVQLDGETYMGCVRKNQIGGLYTVSLVPSDSLKQQLIISVVLICLSVGLSIALIFLVAYVVSRSLASPILTLEQSMQQVQAGKLEKSEIGTEITEIGSLADNFNIMVDRIKLLIEEKVLEEQRRKEIEVEKANAELKFLRAQITPHFLFNTLNSIKWLAVIHGDAPVEEMITALGRLLECSMQKGNDFISLREEVDNVKAYLKIQEMRYGNRIKSEYQIEEEIEKLVVPKLILQPLVENAIIHGIDRNTDGGTISIRIFGRDDSIIMEVEDDGPGFPEDLAAYDEAERSGKSHRLNGIGIQNINKRIQLIYGEEYGLFYQRGKDGKGTVAMLVLLREEQHAEGTAGR